MARIPVPTRESVPEQYRSVFDEVVQFWGKRYSGNGPGTVTLNSPELANRLNSLADYLRGGSGLPAKAQQLAMLTVARELDCQYIWNSHAAAGRREGLSDALVDAMRDKKDLPSMAADEAAVVNYGREFFRTHKVSDATFQAAVQQFGVHGLTNLTNLMAYYALLAFNANAFQIDMPAERTEAILPA